MDYNSNSQISDHLHNSTTVWTQPDTDEKRRYYSKHAAEKRVFGLITTVFQGAHGFIAFAAWTAIYVWVFQKVPLLLPIAPFLSGFTLIALHVLFRVTWQTFWYDKLDNDPNTDSPIWVPLVVIIVLLFAEVQGAKQFLAGQVAPPEKQGTEAISSDHSTLVTSLEQSYANDRAAIESTYKQKERAATLPYDRQIRSARNRSVVTDEERRQRNRDVAALERQRDAALAPVLAAKATALEQAYSAYKTSKDAAQNRRDQAVVQVDAANAAEVNRHSTELASVGTYSWVLSVSLLLLIAGLSYRVVRINVKSGIIPLRNYTVLDAHGSIPERIWTALADALNRRSLQFAVFLHRIFSPKKAITSFDGTVVANPGTYNTPEGFHRQSPPPLSDDQLRAKVANKILYEAAKGEVRITPEMLENEFLKAKSMNGHYFDSELGKKPEPSSPAAASAKEGNGPSQPTTGRTHTPTPLAQEDDEPRWIAFFKKDMLSQLAAYDAAILAGNPVQAQIHQDHLNDRTAPLFKLGKRLGLSWGVFDGDIYVWRDRTPGIKVLLENLTKEALDGTAPHEDIPLVGEDLNLFKCDLNKFKQDVLPERDPVTGKVIGVKYKKADGGWGNIGFAQVKAFYNIYQKYAAKERAGDRVREGFAKWQYAMSLFEQGREVTDENLKTVMV